MAASSNVAGNMLSVDLSGFSSVQPSTLLTIDVNGVFALSAMCNTPWYGVSACPYALVGSEQAGWEGCCPSSFVM